MRIVRFGIVLILAVTHNLGRAFDHALAEQPSSAPPTTVQIIQMLTGESCNPTGNETVIFTMSGMNLGAFSTYSVDGHSLKLERGYFNPKQIALAWLISNGTIPYRDPPAALMNPSHRQRNIGLIPFDFSPAGKIRFNSSKSLFNLAHTTHAQLAPNQPPGNCVFFDSIDIEFTNSSSVHFDPNSFGL